MTTTRRHPSTLSRILAASAERLATAWNVPPDARPHFVANAVHVFEAQFCLARGGEVVRVPLTSQVERQQRHRRIVAALQAGEPPARIAQREGVSERLVRLVRQRTALPVSAARCNSGAPAAPEAMP